MWDERELGADGVGGSAGAGGALHGGLQRGLGRAARAAEMAPDSVARAEFYAGLLEAHRASLEPLR